MVKLFLVEDEIIMRTGIKNNIDWEAEGIEFVGEASDGELAYPQIQKLKPDILITDIKMPFMDGLELTELVRKDFPDMKIIILSGYDEFSYAQKALRLNVTEYLLKPVTSKKLLESVRREAEAIEKSRQELEYTDLTEEMKQERRILEKQMFFRKMVGNELQMSEILEKGKELGMELSASWYQVILCYIGTGGQAGSYSEHQNTVLRGIANSLSEMEGWYDFDRGTEGMAILSMADSEEELVEKANDNLKKMIEIVKKHPQAEYFIGLGSHVNRLRQLGDSYNDANRAFSHRYMQTESAVFDSSHLSEVPKENNMDIHAIDINRMDRKIVSSFLHMGAVDEVPHFIAEYLGCMGSQNVQSVIFLQYITMDLYFCVVSFLKEIGYGIEDVADKYSDINDVVRLFTTLDKVTEYFEKILAGSIQLRDQISRKKFGQILEKAKDYIEKNYNQEDISLNTVAAHVNVSPNYFSTIFSQEIGKTFIEYLTEIRMKKAKELLMTTNKRASEIAYDVGYKDSHYFSFLFKKTQGCTTKEYRNRK